MSGGSGQVDWSRTRVVVGAPDYAAPPHLDPVVFQQMQLQIDRQLMEMWQAGAYTLPILPQHYILYEEVATDSLWEQGAVLHRKGLRLWLGINTLQEPSTPRLPAGTSTLRWVENWAKEQQAVMQKSVWQRVKEHRVSNV